MLDIQQLLGIGYFSIAAFLVTFALTPRIGEMMKRKGITGEDVHKLKKTKIPEMGGLAILLGLAAGSAGYVVLVPDAGRETLAFLGTVLIAGAIGIADDLRPLGARIKPVLTAVACAPIILLGTFDPFPMIPLVGTVRLTLIYPLLILAAIAVTSNAVNMLDVMNGAMAGTVAIISAAATTVLLLAANLKIAAFAAGLFATTSAFYYFNRYPARIFAGDTGSLSVGAALGALAVLGSIETVLVVALIPHIMNAFYGLASVGRLYERRQIRERPTRLLKNGKLQATTERRAPLTLARLILANGPLGEGEIVRGMLFLTFISSILAIMTYAIMAVGRV